MAIGWGRFATPNISEYQHPVLKEVALRVSEDVFKHKSMFGTELKKDDAGIYMDACAGDSGMFNWNVC